MECETFIFWKWMNLHFSKSTGFEREPNMEMDSKESKKREKGRRNGTYPIKTILHEYILLELFQKNPEDLTGSKGIFDLKYPQIKTEIMIWFSTCSKTFQLFMDPADGVKESFDETCSVATRVTNL